VLSIYADKTKLTSFGTKKGYPVIVRCANLPTKIRNGTGLGGGRVIGWLPIVGSLLSLFPFFILMTIFKIDEDASKSKQKSYIDFKRIVWHESFYEVLATIHELSKSGYHIQCADGVVRHIFPAILILSADYEEQYG
jgi:hypothetical protein